MKVQKLIDELNELDPELEVSFYDNNHLVYRKIEKVNIQYLIDFTDRHGNGDCFTVPNDPDDEELKIHQNDEEFKDQSLKLVVTVN